MKRLIKKENFSNSQKEQMVLWRNENISSVEKGFQNGKSYEYIIPKNIWKESLWAGIREDFKLPKYLRDNKIQAHTGTNNLVSSWVNCANLYFPIRDNKELKALMLEFLKKKVSDSIIEIQGVELEFSFPNNHKLSSANLLGESGGSRGSGQTSPDVAFAVKTKYGKGLILIECKYTEHSFYGCSARRINKKANRINNPDPKRCMIKQPECDYKTVCHQTVWGRKYLNLLKFSEEAKNKLQRCPAATSGYQLLRQQALAEGIAKSSQFSLVVSAVAFDDRNSNLKNCLKTTGVSDFQTGWADLFDGKTIFKTWTHQEWVQFVRKQQIKGEFNSWLDYVNKRYNY